MTGKHRYFSRNSIILLGIFFIFALFVRIQFVRLTIDHIYIARDAKQYVQYAHNLVEHGIFSRATSSIHLKPDSYRSPRIPLVYRIGNGIGRRAILPGDSYFFPNDLKRPAGSVDIFHRYIFSACMRCFDRGLAGSSQSASNYHTRLCPDRIAVRFFPAWRNMLFSVCPRKKKYGAFYHFRYSFRMRLPDK